MPPKQQELTTYNFVSEASRDVIATAMLPPISQQQPQPLPPVPAPLHLTQADLVTIMRALGQMLTPIDPVATTTTVKKKGNGVKEMAEFFRRGREVSDIEMLRGLLERKCGGFTIEKYDKYRADTKERTALKGRLDYLVTRGTGASPEDLHDVAAVQRAEEIRQLERRLGDLAADISVSAGAVSSFGRLLRRVSEHGTVFVPLEPVVPGGFIPLRLDRYVSSSRKQHADGGGGGGDETRPWQWPDSATTTTTTTGGNDHAAAKYVLHRVNPQELLASANASLDVDALLQAKDREHKAALEAALLKKGRECNERQTKTMAGLSSSMAKVFNSEFPDFYHNCFVRALDKAHNGEGGGGGKRQRVIAEIEQQEGAGEGGGGDGDGDGGGDNGRDEDDDEHGHRDKRQLVVDSGTDSDGIGN